MDNNKTQALEDFNRIKSTLGFQLFLETIKSQVEQHDSIIMYNTSSLNDLIPQQQSIGAKRALTYLLDNYSELVKQQAT